MPTTLRRAVVGALLGRAISDDDGTFYFYTAARVRTDNPAEVAFIAVRCQCSPAIYLLTGVNGYESHIAFTREWDGNMDRPTIDGSFNSPCCPCHFSIENGYYK